MRVALRAVLIGILFAVFSSMGAQAANPSIGIDEVRAYRNVRESSDLLVFVRYSLYNWSSANYKGTDALARFFDQSSTLQQERYLPRVDFGLAAFYFTSSQASAITWGSAAVTAKIAPNPTSFATTTPTTASLTPVWCTTCTSTSTTATQLTSDIKSMLQSLEINAGLTSGTLVNTINITPTGAQYVMDAYSSITAVIPTAFFAYVQDITVGFSQSTSSSLKTSIDAAAQASSFYTALSNVSTTFFGVNPSVTGGLITVLAALGVFALMVSVTGKTSLGFVSVGPVLLTGMFIGAIDIYWVWVVLGIEALGLANFVWDRMVPRF